MTREGQGRDPEEVLRPASTRWSEPHAANDDALLPPFVPGRSRGHHVPQPEAVESAEPAGSAPEATPASTPEWEAPDSEPALTPDADDEAFPFDGPVSWDGPGTAEPDESQSTPAGAAETGLPGEAAWGSAAEGPAEEESTEEWAGGTWVPEAPPVVGAADEVADRMQHLAARIRRDGASAARSEMASDDRLTALLAALIAGYLEGREG